MADDDIEQLVAKLRRGPTDLARLVTDVLVWLPPGVWVSAKAVEAWRQRDPEAWAKVLAWLRQRASPSKQSDAPIDPARPPGVASRASGGAV